MVQLRHTLIIVSLLNKIISHNQEKIFLDEKIVRLERDKERDRHTERERERERDRETERQRERQRE